MANCLVTGGAGFIGSHLVDRLIDNHKVIVVDSSESDANYAHHHSNSSLGVYKKNINEGIKDIIEDEDIEYVFHMAAISSVPYSHEHEEETNKVNFLGTKKLLEDSLEAGVKRFIFSSSAAVYDPTSSPYATQKFRAENLCNSFNKKGLETVSLRYFNVFGPRQSAQYGAVVPIFVPNAIKGEPINVNGNGEQTRDLIYVEDVVQAIVMAVATQNTQALGKAYDVGAGTGTSINTLAERVKFLSNSDSEITHVSALEEIQDSCADIIETSKMFDWKPEVSLDEGLKKTIKYFQEVI